MRDNEPLIYALFVVGVGILCIWVLAAGVTKSLQEQKGKFMTACQAERQEYECEYMWRQMQ